MSEGKSPSNNASGKGKRAPTLYFIIVFKLAKGLLFLLLALGVYKLAGSDLQDLFDRILRLVHLDPENRFLSDLGDLLDQLTATNVRWVATGTLLYSLFSLVEGIGLILRVPWAAWMTIGESAFFIPIEIFELVRRRTDSSFRLHSELLMHPRVIVLILLLVNILIFWYLFQNRNRLFRHHR